MPADPARLMAGARASAEAVANIRHQYGLDLPILQQYVRYVEQLVQGDLGMSFSSYRPVIEDLKDYFPATVELALYALLFAIVFGTGIGIISALHQAHWQDQTSRLLAILGLSIPSFWLGLQFQLLFYQRLDWFPIGGRVSDGMTMPPDRTGLLIVDSLLSGNWATLIDALHHLVLPGFVLGIMPMAILARIMRTSMLEVMKESYVVAARAKGLPSRRVIFRYMVRNALLSVVTMIGLLIGTLMGGSILVETVFAWPGVGQYMARAIYSADYNAVMGVTLIISLVYLFTNVFVDVIYAKLDPRIRLD
jgi:peptide/nickel transport system permease protein